jgi:RNA-directed DNA polymerase
MPTLKVASPEISLGECRRELHPEKTRVGDCRQPGEGLEFLGYRFGSGPRWVRKKSRKALYDRIRAKTRRSRGAR